MFLHQYVPFVLLSERYIRNNDEDFERTNLSTQRHFAFIVSDWAELGAAAWLGYALAQCISPHSGNEAA